MRTYTFRIFGIPVFQLDVVYWDEKPPEYDDLPPEPEPVDVGEHLVLGPRD